MRDESSGQHKSADLESSSSSFSVSPFSQAALNQLLQLRSLLPGFKMKLSFAASLFLSSLVSAQNKGTFEAYDDEGFVSQLWDYDLSDCTPQQYWLHNIKNYFVLQPEITFSACNDGSDRPAKFWWERGRLYLFKGEKHLQRIYIDGELL